MVKFLGEKLKKIFTYQKKVARVIFFADHLALAKPLMIDMNAFNNYQTNIYQNLILVYNAYTGTAPSIFFNKFSKINHDYLTTSKNSGNYTTLKSTMMFKNFAISRRGPILLIYSSRSNTERDRIFTTIQSKSQRNAFLRFILLIISKLTFFC